MQQILSLAKKLEELGMSDKEARVYVAALFLGAASAQRIAEQAQINRVTTYDALEELKKIGMITESKEGKKTVFIAEGPEAIDHIFDHQIDLAQKRRAELKELLPELNQFKRDTEGSAPVVRFYKGTEGIKATVDYVFRKANQKSTIYAMTNYDEVLKFRPDIFKTSPKRRLKKKISSKLFYFLSKGEVKTDPKLLRETFKLDEPVKADINLYENIALLVSYHEKEPIGVVIESPGIVAGLRQLFELAWKNQNKNR